jgi:hypothetical protein
VQLSGNSALSSLDGLSGLTSVGFNLVVSNSDSLKSLAGLGAMGWRVLGLA